MRRTRHPANFVRMHGEFQVCVTREYDETHESPEVDPGNYLGCTAAEIEAYIAQDQARLDAWKRDEWHYLVLGVELHLDTATHWAIPPIVGKAYLHGIESDSEESYFTSTVEELLHEALADARHTLSALQAATQSVEVR